MNKILKIISYLLVPFAFFGSFMILLFVTIKDIEWVDVVNMASDIHDELLSKLRMKNGRRK